MDADEGKPVIWLDDGGNDFSPVPIADGRKVAFIRDNLTFPKLMIANADGSNVLRLLNLNRFKRVESLDWTPQGPWDLIAP